VVDVVTSAVTEQHAVLPFELADQLAALHSAISLTL
jgi:hypothetical protein